jgi:hypothetical protein
MAGAQGWPPARAQPRDQRAAKIAASGGHRAHIGRRGEGGDQGLMDKEARRVAVGQKPVGQALQVLGQDHDLEIALGVRQHLGFSFLKRLKPSDASLPWKDLPAIPFKLRQCFGATEKSSLRLLFSDITPILKKWPDWAGLFIHIYFRRTRSNGA